MPEEIKVPQEVINALFQKDLTIIMRDMEDLKKSVQAIHKRMDADDINGGRYMTRDEFAEWKKDDFNFWRNLLVVGMLGSTAVGVISLVIQKVFTK